MEQNTKFQMQQRSILILKQQNKTKDGKQALAMLF